MALPATCLRPFIFDRAVLGLVDDLRAARLAHFACFHVTNDAVRLDSRLDTVDARSRAMADVALALRREGALPAWRDEPYAVARRFDDPPVLLIERGAARYLGVRTYAAHVNGIVHADGETRMWLARRSPQKKVDPGMLDNLVGGGVAAGFRVDATVVKEAWEEAGVPERLARHARPAGMLHSRRPMFDGLQRETLFVHDLALPPDFIPANQDGEAVEHRLVSVADAARAIAVANGHDEVTLDASLVVLDYLIRQGHVQPDQPCYAALAALRLLPLSAGETSFV